MMLEVMHRHEKLAPESGVEFRLLMLFLERVSGALERSVCQRRPDV